MTKLTELKKQQEKLAKLIAEEERKENAKNKGKAPIKEKTAPKPKKDKAGPAPKNDKAGPAPKKAKKKDDFDYPFGKKPEVMTLELT